MPDAQGRFLGITVPPLPWLYPYIWHWGQKPTWGRGTPPRLFDRDRKGERCRVVCRGAMNSALIEFEDGYWTITSRNGIRRAQ